MHFRLFAEEVYTQRRKSLMESMQSGILLFLGNEEVGMNYADNTYPFRQDSTFLYYFGIDIPGLAAIIDADAQQTILFGDDISLDGVIWTGPLPTMAYMADQVGISKTASISELAGYLSNKKNIHYLPPYRAVNQIKLSSLLNQPLGKIKENFSLKLIKAVIGQRSFKSALELTEMEAACDISADMHLAAMQYAKPGMKEYEVAAQVRKVAYEQGGALAYPIILTVNGETLHNHYHGNTLAPGHLLLIDAGAENDLHYAGDLTRTFPVSSKYSEQQKDIYNLVIKMMDNAIDALKPGITYKEVHGIAAKTLIGGMLDLGILKGNAEEAFQNDVHTLFFQHGLGHMIGLDVHDMEDLGELHVGYEEGTQKSKAFGWKSLRLARTLQTGMTFTVEPGIYFIPTLIDRWYNERKLEQFINYEELLKYKNFSGVRVEDNYVITDTGARKLGKYLPKYLSEIEAIRES
jgi:Xaa-Pro aminopeptidase